jgi:IclR family acetate operon transcriptional repressor
MADVSAATRENLRLWLIEGETLAIIETVEGDHAVRPVELPPGAAVPLHATAVGKAVLASWSDHALENFLARPLPAFTPATITDPAALRRQIHQAQARGYAEVSDEAQIDIGGVAAVFRLPDERLGALALTFPRHRLDRDTVVTFGGLVAAAARKIEDSVNGTRAA